ncbi:MAG: YlbF family regulator [Clostridiales bacterium]|nr:YlbF family regulator [Clostridiales bacterium]
MSDIKKSVENLVDALKDSDEFRRYREACGQVRRFPEQEKRLREFRKKNFQLQNAAEQIDLFSESDKLMAEYQDLYGDPVSREFLAAEVAVCRIVQKVNRELIEFLEFENPLL